MAKDDRMPKIFMGLGLKKWAGVVLAQCYESERVEDISDRQLAINLDSAQRSEPRPSKIPNLDPDAPPPPFLLDHTLHFR
jgi:hypothetical protein